MVISYNVNGLNEPIKRSQIFRQCNKLGGKIVLLQETHFKEGHTPHLSLRHYPQIYTSNNPQKKATGVMTLIHKDLPFQLREKLIDEEGRFIFLKGQIAKMKVTITNVYAPNQAQLPFLH
uniref:exodeoxyribonuclease III n=1 Tax=Xenopus tropicalis TaxID=8364 RepID=A0A6I8PNV6_XENTR